MTTVKMTDQEINDAGEALINWFKSQDIGPASGSAIMVRLLANQIAGSRKDGVKLTDALANFIQLLTVETAIAAVGKKGLNDV